LSRFVPSGCDESAAGVGARTGSEGSEGWGGFTAQA
jgi:hypothetical protein